MLNVYKELNYLFTSNLEKTSQEPSIKEVLISNKSLTIEKVFKKLNDYIRKYKDKCSELHKSCERLKCILQNQF